MISWICEAAREIRLSGRPDADVPIIAMTANSFREDEEAAKAAGMNGFVSKPYDPETLFAVLGSTRPDASLMPSSSSLAAANRSS